MQVDGKRLENGNTECVVEGSLPLIHFSLIDLTKRDFTKHYAFHIHTVLRLVLLSTSLLS